MRPLAILAISTLMLACDNDGPTLLPDAGATGVEAGLDLPQHEGFDPGPDLSADLSADTVAPDGPTLDGPPMDLAPQADGGAFPAVLQGTWLIGWGGGMNHYSWIRFTVDSSGVGGPATILDGASLTANLPFWNCSGSTSWNITAKPDTIQLHFPSSTCTGLKSASYTFNSFKPGGYPKGSILQASINSLQLPPNALEGYKFPDTQCNKPMTSCTDPLK